MKQTYTLPLLGLTVPVHSHTPHLSLLSPVRDLGGPLFLAFPQPILIKSCPICLSDTSLA